MCLIQDANPEHFRPPLPAAVLGPYSFQLPFLACDLSHRSELALLVMHVGIRIRSLHHDLCAQRHRAELRRALLLTTKAFSTSRFHSSLASPLPGPLRGCAHLVSCHLKDQAGLGALAWSVIQGLNGLSCMLIGITPRHSCVWPDIVSITPPPRLRYDLSIIPQWRFSLLHA